MVGVGIIPPPSSLPSPRGLNSKGVYPPINPLPSLSRLMGNGIGKGKTRADHKNVSDQLFAAYANGLDLRKLVAITGEDALTENDKLFLKFADDFETYFVCTDVKNAEIYNSLLRKKYRSYMAIRLAKFDEIDLGYIVILSRDKMNFEYDETKKDLRYKTSLLVQYFKTVLSHQIIQDRVVKEELLKKTHIEVICNLEEDMKKMIKAVDELSIVIYKVTDLQILY